jgi:prephenate dehydrogenase
METLVVGAGSVGRWFAACSPDDVAFADVDHTAAEAAAEAAHRTTGRVGRAVALDTEESFGTVCIAVPLPEATSAIRRHAPRAQTAVIDLTGQMVEPLQAMASVAPARERASFHPLFAPEHAPGRVAMSRSAPGPATDRVRRWFRDAGNEIVEVEPTTHDDAMETIQGRAHAAILAFALAAESVPTELGTPVYDDLRTLVDRVTGGDARVYADIQSTFGGSTDVAEAARQIADADAEAFAHLYREAGLEDVDRDG